MIASLALLLAVAQPAVPGRFEHGAWRGRCYRSGYLGGYDHERCTVDLEVEEGLDALEQARRPVIGLERTAEGLLIRAWTNGCRTEGGRVLLAPPAFAGADRVAIATAFVREQVTSQIRACGSSVRIPFIRRSEVAALLQATDGLALGNFLQLDPTERAPAAAACGQQLATAWKAEMQRHTFPADSRVQLLMYTLSDGGPSRAERRFQAAPEIMEMEVALGTGPGGSAIFASKPVSSWRDVPLEKFETICDIAIEAWSSFVELSLRPSDEGNIRDLSAPPIFAVRAGTGVAGMEGYAISAAPIVPQPRPEKDQDLPDNESASPQFGDGLK